jgi:hypothetical protein
VRDTESQLKEVLRDITKVRVSLQKAQPHAIGTAFVFAEMGAAASGLRRIERELEALIGKPERGG